MDNSSSAFCWIYQYTRNRRSQKNNKTLYLDVLKITGYTQKMHGTDTVNTSLLQRLLEEMDMALKGGIYHVTQRIQRNARVFTQHVFVGPRCLYGIFEIL